MITTVGTIIDWEFLAVPTDEPCVASESSAICLRLDAKGAGLGMIRCAAPQITPDTVNRVRDSAIILWDSDEGRVYY